MQVSDHSLSLTVLHANDISKFYYSCLIDRDAPVDSMGCDKCFDADAEENIKRFHHLIALMLSSQTKDAVTYEV